MDSTNTAYKATLIPGFTNSWYVKPAESESEDDEDEGSHQEEDKSNGQQQDGGATTPGSKGPDELGEDHREPDGSI